MKLLFVGDGDIHLGELEMDGDSVTIKTFKPEFKPTIVDAPQEDDLDDMAGIQKEAIEEDADKDGGMSKVFAMKKKPDFGKEEEAEQPEEEEEDEESKVKKPMKQKRVGLF